MTDRTVTVTATGRAVGVPDTLTANLTAQSRGTSAGDVLSETNQRARTLLDVLATAGVDPRDVATTGAHLGPTWDRDGQPDGYSAESSLRVTLRDLDAAGGQLDAAVRAGGDGVRIDSIQLGFADDAALVSAARSDAVVQARRQAEELATAEGATVGEVLTITELGPAGIGVFPQARSLAMSAEQSMPIAAGSQELSVSVQATFSLS